MAAVLDGLLALPPSDPIRQRLDPTRVVGAGHSGGAISALGLFTEDGPEWRDKRFIAGLILAGNSIGVGETFRDPPGPMLFVHAEKDPIVPYWTGRTAYAGISWPKAFLTLRRRAHPAHLSQVAPVRPRETATTDSSVVPQRRGAAQRLASCLVCNHLDLTRSPVRTRHSAGNSDR
jgi:poly(3-hydroxybutyrate) depolymerase